MNGIVEKYHDHFKRTLLGYVRKGLMLDRLIEALTPEDHDEVDNPAHTARSTILLGLWIVVFVFGVFGIWSALAQLNSAAIAPGKVVVSSNRKTISHLEGGIVEAILVDDGDGVKKGQPLIRLQQVRAKAQVALLKSQYLNSLAIEGRLLAERDGKSSITFHPDLLKYLNDPNLIEIMNNQRSIFTSRTENIKGQLEVLQTRIVQADEEIKGYQLQADAMANQVRYLNEEIGVVSKLLKTGNAVRPRLLSLQRDRSELLGRQGEYLSLKAKSLESINETKLQILNAKSDYMNKLVEELKQTQLDLAEDREKLAASDDVLQRVVIRAPVDGTVNDLMVHTTDGIVKPGEKIMDIIPAGDTMVIEAKVAPQDIDVVKPGLPARVRLTAYKTRVIPPVDGTVTYVSADGFTDERTGQSYFLAKIEVNAAEIAQYTNVKLYPGMPAEGLIITGSRSFLSYMMEPITQSFNHSFRQQ